MPPSTSELPPIHVPPRHPTPGPRRPAGGPRRIPAHLPPRRKRYARKPRSLGRPASCVACPIRRVRRALGLQLRGPPGRLDSAALWCPPVCDHLACRLYRGPPASFLHPRLGGRGPSAPRAGPPPLVESGTSVSGLLPPLDVLVAIREPGRSAGLKAGLRFPGSLIQAATSQSTGPAAPASPARPLSLLVRQVKNWAGADHPSRSGSCRLGGVAVTRRMADAEVQSPLTSPLAWSSPRCPAWMSAVHECQWPGGCFFISPARAAPPFRDPSAAPRRAPYPCRSNPEQCRASVACPSTYPSTM